MLLLDFVFLGGFSFRFYFEDKLVYFIPVLHDVDVYGRTVSAFTVCMPTGLWKCAAKVISSSDSSDSTDPIDTFSSVPPNVVFLYYFLVFFDVLLSTFLILYLIPAFCHI